MSGIDWGALGTEFVLSLVFAGGAVAIYALGLRLLAVGAPPELRLETAAVRTEHVADGEIETPHRRPAVASFAAYLCFAIDIAVVLYGLYMIIPQFH
ncbi:hypothetical protein [Gryllotalpicola ginsengisoli]|uniref:hypothetical protein n=1 Tax=Gryllotalpicola ginsengisoli TaxID=444608 RepID=UPI0003B46F2B|nr:hypothetical protein [Gryllotalpicola ginsengisoli]